MSSPKNNLSRRDFLKIAGAGSAAATVYGLSGGRALASPARQVNDVTATLNVFDFGSDKQLKIYADDAARFNKRFPNVTVKDELIAFPDGWGQYITILKARFAGGNPPDIVAIAIEGARQTVQSDLMIPLDPYLDKDPAAKDMLSDVDKALNDALKYQGKTYWATREWNNMCIHYNVQMFADAKIAAPTKDWTWDKFLETALKLTTGSGDSKIYGFGIPYFNFGLAPWWHTNGTSTLSPDWTASNLDDPKMLESVKFVSDLVNKHGVSPSVQGTDQFALFAAGRVAMTAAGHWPIAQWQDAKLNMDVQYWPRKTAGTTVFGSGGWGITKTCKNPDVAWELIKDLTSRENDRALAAVGAAIPARRSATDIPEFKAFPKNSDVFYGSLADIKPIPSPGNFAQVEEIFMRNLGAIMAKQVTPEQGLEAAHKELATAMADLKASS